MKPTSAALSIALVALLVVWALPGCKSPSSNTIDQDLLTREQAVDFDDEYGGYNFGDEAEAFGDPVLSAEYGPETVVEFDDPIAKDPSVVELGRRPHARYFLMITWGNLRADTTIDFSTEWSGSLCVDNGVVLLRSTILFDARDQILPRLSRDKLSWISYTQPHFDGILVELHKVVHRDTTCQDNATAVTDTHKCEVPPLVVKFKTAPLDMSFTEDELEDLHRVVPVDDAGNAVAFNSIAVQPTPCPGGFLGGQWRNVTHRPGGIFRGKWISYNGLHMGFLRGAYGPNSRGEKVFFGKWIARGGGFRGLLKGRYGSFDARPGGWFEGVWLTRGLRIGGALRGVWHTDDNLRGAGCFRGRWASRCPTATP